MKVEDTLDHLTALILFYRNKLEQETLTGSEGQIYVRCLMLMGLRDATMRSRQLDQLTDANLEAMELPFEANEKFDR